MAALTETEEVSKERGALGIYMMEMRHDLLTPEEERRLGSLIRSGDIKARDRLVRMNLRLVISIAGIYGRRSPQRLADLIQEGNMGLLHAANRFDPERGCRFSTYATWWIKQAILRSISKMSFLKMPQDILNDMRRISKTEYAFLMKNGIPPSDADLAGETGISERRVREIRSGMHISSLDEGYGSDEDKSLHDILPDAEAEHAATSTIENTDLVDKLLQLFNDNRVPKSQRALLPDIVRRAYGLGGYDAQSVPEIAADLRLQPGRVDSLLKTAKRWMTSQGGKLLRTDG